MHGPKNVAITANLRTRIKRLIRRMSYFANTITMHDLVVGLFIDRYACGVAISHGINTCETPSRLSPSIRHKVDLQPLMESHSDALEHRKRMAFVIGVF